MFTKTLIAAGLTVGLAVGAVAPVSATSLAFEFGSGGAGFSIESAPPGGGRLGIQPAPRGRTGWGWDRGGRERRQLFSAQDIRQALRGQGFRDIQNLQRRGAIYQAQAVDPRGDRVGLVVNAQNGAILNIYRMR